MKIFLFIFCLTVFCLGITHAQDIPCNDIVKLTTKLTSIRDSDQNIRMSLIKKISNPNDSIQLKQITKKMQATDKENQLFVSKLLDQCGWPKGLGFLENNTIFLVIDHADTIFMNRYFPFVKQQSENGTVQKSDLATLQDRMLMRKGLKQLYGTQTFKNINTKQIMFWPIENPDHLADRRSTMGLLPMDNYMKLFKSTSNADVLWDKNLSVEEAKKGIKKQP